MLENSAMRISSANGRTSACVNLILSQKPKQEDSLCLPIDFDEKNPLDGDGGVGRDDVVARVEVLYQKGEHGDELVFCQLAMSESGPPRSQT